MLAYMRGRRSFILISIFMVISTAIVSSISEEAAASLIASRMTSDQAPSVSGADLDTVQAFLEKKIVVARLNDFGMSKEEALAKVGELDGDGLHTLAGIIKSGPAGGDALGVLIGVAILAILVIIILKLLDKEIIIK